MPINETILSSEQKSKEQALQYEDEQKFAAKLAQSMDLPSTLTQEIDEHVKESKKPVEEAPEEVEEPEEIEDEQQEEVQEEEEELVPKSKVQKRFDELTAETKRLKAELANLAKQREEKQAPRDPELDQLEQLSQEELKTLKRQVRVQQVKAGIDETKLSQLLDLEEKIDRTINTAPARFQKNQVQRFDQAVRETAETFEDFDSVKTDIFNQAKAIYDSSPELQGSVSGQERAWKFAVDHFVAIKKASEGKSDNVELKRQVNTLKKKISVDTTSKKTIQPPDNMQKSFKKAVHGDDSDKANYIRKRMNTDALVSDDLLGNL